ncbi:MAG: pilus assembly protein, partial [Lautropia sp.]
MATIRTAATLPIAASPSTRLPLAALPLAALLLAAAALWPRPAAAAAPYQLADQPVSAKLSMPANVLLDLSVEWPTGNVQAHNDETDGTGCPGRDGGYSVCYFTPATRAARMNAANTGNPLYVPKPSMPYIGYFDPFKCYQYGSGYFSPVGYTSGFSAVHHYSAQPASSTATCSGSWSGNFLNWATTQTIDMFRWAMTGGDRVIDTPTLTVLQKARHDGQGGTSQFPVKRIGIASSDIPVTAPSSVSPYTSGALYLRVSGLDTAMQVSAAADFSAATTFDVSVQVCDPAYPESITPCTAYGSSLKPTGLVQENADAVRFGAFGYLLDNDIYRDGGVLRSRMKFVGPQRPTLSSGGTAANTAAEWDPATGVFIQNPDPLDAAATTALNPATPVVRSGLIQHLNKFGRLNGYKSHDPFAELIYESIRYYKNIGPTPEYSNFGLTPGAAGIKIDGFPVITNWDDPLAPPPGFESALEWCPKNFIIGIADANTHKDKRLPGNGDAALETAATPSNADPDINVSALLNTIIASESSNEGVTLLKFPTTLGPLTPGAANGLSGSAYPAALAYYANTQDLRPDTAAPQTVGKQTVKTFMVDVREANGWGNDVPRSDPRRRNQLWLAGKYGGFNDLNGNGVLDAGDALADINGDGVIDVLDVWDGNGDLLPDGYFEASSPEALVEGLKSAFTTIKSEISSNATVAVATKSVELQAGNALYQVNYDQGFWSGDLVAYDYTDFNTTSGLVNAAKVWSAAEKLEALDWSARRIVTAARDAKVDAWSGAIPFRWDDLTSWQKSQLDDNPAVLEFLRGRNDNAAFRRRLRSPGVGLGLRPAKLGDIVDSAPRHVAKPQAPLADQFNPGYASFADAKKSRRPMIYVGANDGMLHAFDARIDHADGGTEVFGYVPSLLFAGPTAPAKDGLRALANRGYLHRYYVNASPVAADVDFARTNGATATGDWRTVLVAGLGKGGRGFFAIDVTDPAAFTSESAVAGKVLWEFSHPTMGFSFGEPQIVKTRRWGWVVLLTSGYNNTAANGSTGTGGGYLYVVDIKTGALLQLIATGSGTEASPAG